MDFELYPKYEECTKCNYYEDSGLYETCLWECKIHYKKVKTRASKIFTNNGDAQIAFRKLCELTAAKTYGKIVADKYKTEIDFLERRVEELEEEVEVEAEPSFDWSDLD